MKKIAIPLAAAFVLFSFAAHAGTEKLDLMLKTMASTPSAGKAILSKSVVNLSGREEVDVLVKSNDVELTTSSIESAGGMVRSVTGNIMTAFVPVSYLSDLSALYEVVSVEASTAMHRLMNTARSAES